MKAGSRSIAISTWISWPSTSANNYGNWRRRPRKTTPQKTSSYRDLLLHNLTHTTPMIGFSWAVAADG